MNSSARDVGQSLQPLAGAGGHEEPDEQESRANPLIADMEEPWANSREFFVDLFVLCFLACIIGVASFIYSYIVGELLEKWLSAVGDGDYPKAYLKGGPSLGCWLWILVCWAGATMVGVLKCALGLDTFAPFIVEIRKQHCDPLPAFKTCFCCMASLLSGAALGPEAGLASFGGGLGTFLASQVASMSSEYAHEEVADARRRLYVLGGITAAFGTIMPSPWVALLICMECSLLKADEEGRRLIVFGRRTLFLLGITAIVAFTVRYAVKPIPLLPNLAGRAQDAGEKYSNFMPFEAVLLGAIGAAVALVYAVIGALVKAVFIRIGGILERCLGWGGRVVGLCSLAGLVTGVLGFLVPLSLASGKESMIPTILAAGPVADATGSRLTASYLVTVAIAKTVSFAAASAGGLVGGPFFPILYIGVVVGELCEKLPINWSIYPGTLTVPVVMVAIPSAVFPVPFTMVAIPLCYFRLGPLWCVPLLVGIITSYTLVVGSGLAKRAAGG